MAKLIFTTKPPRKGYNDYEALATHQTNGYEGIAKKVNESESLHFITEEMRQLLDKLDAMGYDKTTARFSIKVK